MLTFNFFDKKLFVWLNPSLDEEQGGPVGGVKDEVFVRMSGNGGRGLGRGAVGSLSWAWFEDSEGLPRDGFAMRYSMRRGSRLGAGVGLILGFLAALGADAPRPAEVTWPGMTSAGAVLLPNGWSLKPAGRQLALGDFPVLMAENPAFASRSWPCSHAGYGEHEILTFNAKTSKILGRVVLPHSFSGLVWSADGSKLYAGGGFDDLLYGFDHKDGLLSNKVVFEYPDRRDSSSPIRPPAFGEPGPKNASAARPGWLFPAMVKLCTRRTPSAHTLAAFDVETRTACKRKSPLGAEPRSLMPWSSTRPTTAFYASLWGQARVAYLDLKTMARPGPLPRSSGASQRDAPGARRRGSVRGQRQPQHGDGDRHSEKMPRRSRRSTPPSTPATPDGSTPSSLGHLAG